MTTSPTTGAGRARILRAARALFLERGFADVSMQQIADAASITKATLYHHFRDKEDLFIEVVRRQHQRAAHELTELIAGATSLDERLRRIAIAFFASDEGGFERLMEDLFRHVSPERFAGIHKELHEAAPSPEGVIRDCFADAIAAGEIAPHNPDLLAALFFSMVHGLRWMNDCAPTAPFGEEDAASIPHLLLHGITSPATAPSS